MSHPATRLIVLLAGISLSGLATPAFAEDLWPEVRERLEQKQESIMPALGDVREKAPAPLGKMVTRDLRTGEVIERDDDSLRGLLDRHFTEGQEGLLEKLSDGEPGYTPQNFTAWSQVTDPSAGNYRKRVKLWMQFVDINGQTVSSQCSGTLLDPYHVLTAAHCIFAWDTQNTTVNDWASSVRVAAGYEGTSYPFGDAQAVSYTSWTGWTQNNDQDHDVGIITLDRPIGLLTGWYGYGFNEDCDYFTGGSWHMAGYPAEAPFDGTLMYEATGNYDDCPVTGWDDQIRWYMPSSGGLSGSGAQRGGTIWAVLSTSNRTTRSSVCRLTEGKFDDTVSLLAAETHNSPDVLPMTVQSSLSVVLGESIGSLSFLLGNTASVSASGTWNYRVYLSTDTQIDTGDILLDSGSFVQSLPPRGAAWVSVPGPSVPPSFVPSGQYSIGVIITNNDANFSNNDSSGQDAAQIDVLCPSQPAVPVAQNPANGAICVETASVWIDWSDIGSWASYQLEIGTPGNYQVYTTPQTHYVVQNLDQSTTYNWRVRAQRACSQWSAWSSSRSFSTVIDPYTYTSLVSPTEGQHCTDAGGTMLEWTALPQASWYEVQISDNWCYEGTIYSPVGTQLYLSNLTPNTTYYWRVRARTSCGTYTNWSSVPGFCFSFKTAATTAAAPVPNIPFNGSTCASPDPYLQWNHTEDWDSYEVQVGISCGTGTVYQTTANGIQLNDLQDNVTYFWRIRVTQECGLTSAWSACSSFSVDAVVPTNPTQISSNTHTVGVWSGDNTVDVWWDYGNDACSGWVEYGTVWDASPLTIPDTPPLVWEPEFSSESSPPLPDGVHWFHLRSIDQADNWAVGALHWGPIWIDANPPTDPVVNADLPIDVWQNAASIAVGWSATDPGSGVDYYLVAFDQSPLTTPTTVTTQTSIGWPINGDGQWWVHVSAVDAITQVSSISHLGPFLIDTTAPQVTGTFPDASSSVPAGDAIEISFEIQSKVPDPNLFNGELKFSSDGGTSFTVAKELTPEELRAGTTRWDVPPVSTDNAVLRLCIRDTAGNEGQDESAVFPIQGATAVANDITERLGQLGNYPNPFNPQTTIVYSLALETDVRLAVFDARGRRVRLLVDDRQRAGEQQIVWNGTDDRGRAVPSGIYYYRLTTDGVQQSRRMVLAK